LALLALNAGGHTHRFGTSKRTINRGLKWLKKQVEAHDGDLSAGSADPVPRLRAQSLGSLALSTLYAASRDFTLKRPAERALAVLLERDLRRAQDTPPGVLVWAFTALDAARAAGLHVPLSARARLLAAVNHAPSGDLGEDALALWARADPELKTPERVLGPLRASVWDELDRGALGRGTLDEWLLVSRAGLRDRSGAWGVVHRRSQQAALRLQRPAGCEAGTWDPVLPSELAQDRLSATALFVALLSFDGSSLDRPERG
jgi:hypothetical protein